MAGDGVARHDRRRGQGWAVRAGEMRRAIGRLPSGQHEIVMLVGILDSTYEHAAPHLRLRCRHGCAAPARACSTNSARSPPPPVSLATRHDTGRNMIMNRKTGQADGRDEVRSGVAPRSTPERAKADWQEVEGADIRPAGTSRGGGIVDRSGRVRTDEHYGEGRDNYQDSDEVLPDDREEASISRNPSREGGRFDEN